MNMGCCFFQGLGDIPEGSGITVTWMTSDEFSHTFSSVISYKLLETAGKITFVEATFNISSLLKERLRALRMS